MESDDLQVGAVWTHPEWRRRGLAAHALTRVITNYGSEHRLWYITDQSNLPSKRVALGVGFHKYGVGVRTTRLGLRLFGAYQILSRE